MSFFCPVDDFVVFVACREGSSSPSVNVPKPAWNSRLSHSESGSWRALCFDIENGEREREKERKRERERERERGQEREKKE